MNLNTIESIVENRQMHVKLPEVEERVRVLGKVCSVNCLDGFLQST